MHQRNCFDAFVISLWGEVGLNAVQRRIEFGKTKGVW